MRMMLFLFAAAMAVQAQGATPEKPASIRYQVEYRETGDVVVHVSELLSSGTVFSGSCMRGYGEEVPGCDLYKKLLGVRGVQEITLDRYQVGVKADALFSWKEVIEGIVKAVQSYLGAKEMKAESPIMPSEKQDQRRDCRPLALFATK